MLVERNTITSHMPVMFLHLHLLIQESGIQLKQTPALELPS